MYEGLAYRGPATSNVVSIDPVYFDIPELLKKQQEIYGKLYSEDNSKMKTKLSPKRDRSVDHRYLCSSCNRPFNLTTEELEYPCSTPLFLFVMHRMAVEHPDTDMDKWKFQMQFELWGETYHAGYVIFFQNSSHFVCFAQFKGIWFRYDDMRNNGFAVPSDDNPIEWQMKQPIHKTKYSGVRNGCVPSCVVYVKAKRT